MIIKSKWLLPVLIFFMSSILYAQSKYDGIWVSRSTYYDIISSGKMNDFVISKNDFSWGNVKFYSNFSLQIDTKQNLFFSPELAAVKLIKIEQAENKAVIYLDKFYEDVNYHWEIQLFISEIKDGIISFETENEILDKDYS